MDGDGGENPGRAPHYSSLPSNIARPTMGKQSDVAPYRQPTLGNRAPLYVTTVGADTSSRGPAGGSSSPAVQQAPKRPRIQSSGPSGPPGPMQTPALPTVGISSGQQQQQQYIGPPGPPPQYQQQPAAGPETPMGPSYGQYAQWQHPSYQHPPQPQQPPQYAPPSVTYQWVAVPNVGPSGGGPPPPPPAAPQPAPGYYYGQPQQVQWHGGPPAPPSAYPPSQPPTPGHQYQQQNPVGPPGGYAQGVPGQAEQYPSHGGQYQPPPTTMVPRGGPGAAPPFPSAAPPQTHAPQGSWQQQQGSASWLPPRPAPPLAPRPPSQQGGQYAGPSNGSKTSGQQMRIPMSDQRARAIQINKRITQAHQAKEILDIVQYEVEVFDTVALATAVHRLASLRGAPNLHEQITRSPEFYKLVQTIKTRGPELHVRNIANILWGLAKMNYLPSKDFMEALCEQLPNKLDQAVAQNVSNTLWALSALSYKPAPKVLDALAKAARAKVHEFTSQHISNTVLAFAKLEYHIDPEILEALGQTALEKLTTFTAQALSNTLWGLSKLGIANGELFLTVGAAAKANLQQFNAQNLANTVYAYGNLGLSPGDDMLEEFSALCIHKINEFTPQNLSNVAWAYAKLEKFDSALFGAMAWRAVQTMHAFSPQSVANIMWAYASLGRAPDPAFLRAAMSHSLPRLGDWVAQNLANAAWALGVLHEDQSVATVLPTFLPALVAEVTKRLNDPAAEREFSRQHLSNYIWALATSEYNPGEAALRVVTHSLRERASLCIPQELTTSVWSCAKLQFYDGPFMDRFAKEAVSRIDEFVNQNVSNMAYGFAKLSHYDPDLMVALAGAAVEQVHDMSEQQLGTMMWSLAALNVSSPATFQVLMAELRQRIINDETVLPVAPGALWACAVADVLDHDTWADLVTRIHSSGVEKLTNERGSQIFQAWMLATARHPKEDWSLDPELMRICMAAWKSQVSEVTISEFHSEVSRTLNAMGIPHTLEHLTDDGLFSMDIALPEEHIAIEVDGPHHFTKNQLRPLADMFTRTVLLEARGWRVVSVPFFSWIGVDDLGRRSLLQNLLEKVRTGEVAHPTKEPQGVGKRGVSIEVKAGGPVTGDLPAQQNASVEESELAAAKMLAISMVDAALVSNNTNVDTNAAPDAEGNEHAAAHPTDGDEIFQRIE